MRLILLDRSDNMFVPHFIELDPELFKAHNTLHITFESAMNVGNALYQEKGHLICWNGHYCRVYVRKAQYHFGWDWGPSLVTAGPWKPIHLEVYKARIDDLRVEARLSEDLKSGTLHLAPTIRHDGPGLSIVATVSGPDGQKCISTKLHNGQETILAIPEPEVWYPFTHGKQALYQVKASLVTSEGSKVLHEVTKTVGFRRVELIQSPLDEGSTFYFSVNNIPIFMGGSNWIPGDNFLPRMNPERYRRWMDLVVRGNQNMIRVWGGGIYEDDAFYDECDQRGILVWQDFGFACCQYPFDENFVNSVKEEATAAIRRLRSHPSLAILAGNNEDYQVANEACKISSFLQSQQRKLIDSSASRHDPS
jgi:beta-mannosidase